MKAIITVGISGSGKSTWAARQSDFIIVNRDDTRWELSGKTGWNGVNCYKFSSKIEDKVTKVNNIKIFDCYMAKQNVIVSDTNLNSNFRKQLTLYLKAFGYEIEIKEFPISFQEACKRDKERGIYAVGEAVLIKQWESWIKYWEYKQQGAW